MSIIFLIAHGLLAFLLLGAITHQCVSMLSAQAPPSTTFLRHVQSVRASVYTNAVVYCYALNFILGAILYSYYRVEVRPSLEDAGMLAAAGTFEAKEHLASLGLGLLPAYWVFWNAPAYANSVNTRRAITLLLAFFAWWNFLVGHVINNLRGLAP